MKKKLIGVKFDTLDPDDEGYTALSVEECRDPVDAMIFEEIMRDRETVVITQGHTFATPLWADEIWYGHEKIVVYANSGRWRRVEVGGDLWGVSESW